MLTPNWKNRLSIGTAKAGDTWTYAPLCAGIENMAEALNEQTQQYFFMCGEGYAHNEVTAMAPAITISGKRIHGDAAQDALAAMKYKLAEERYTSVKLEERYMDATTKKAMVRSMTCDATVTAITTVDGDMKTNTPFSCTLSLNGKPTLTETAEA